MFQTGIEKKKKINGYGERRGTKKKKTVKEGCRQHGRLVENNLFGNVFDKLNTKRVLTDII